MIDDALFMLILYAYTTINGFSLIVVVEMVMPKSRQTTVSLYNHIQM